MKKIYLLLLILTLTACSGISQEDYDSAINKNSEYSDQVNSLEGEVNSLTLEVETLTTELDDITKTNEELDSEIIALEDDYTNLDAEYKTYKEKMKPYEELDEAEAEARRIEAEKVAEEEAAAKKAEEERLAQEAAEKEAAGYETGITYDQLARTPDDYYFEKVKFYGRVVQLIEGDEYNNLRVAVDDNYDQIILIEYDPSTLDIRILEDDYITAYGYSMGIISYQSTMGGKISIPAMIADTFELH